MTLISATLGEDRCVLVKDSSKMSLLDTRLLLSVVLGFPRLSVTQFKTGEQSMSWRGSMPASELTGLTAIMSELRRDVSRAVSRERWAVEVVG